MGRVQLPLINPTFCGDTIFFYWNEIGARSLYLLILSFISFFNSANSLVYSENRPSAKCSGMDLTFCHYMCNDFFSLITCTLKKYPLWQSLSLYASFLRPGLNCAAIISPSVSFFRSSLLSHVQYTGISSCLCAHIVFPCITLPLYFSSLSSIYIVPISFFDFLPQASFLHDHQAPLLVTIYYSAPYTF